MAQIISLDEMEQIVGRNKMLSWDGWTVLHTYPNPVGWRDAEGVQIKGRWFTQRRYVPAGDGWTIPNKLVR